MKGKYVNNFKETIIAFAEEKKLSNREISIILNIGESTLEAWLYRGVMPPKETQKDILSLIKSTESYRTIEEYITKNTKGIMKCIDLMEKNNIKVEAIKTACVKALCTRREFLDKRKKRDKARKIW